MNLCSEHIRWLLALALVVTTAGAWASDIQCKSTQQVAERVICDHAILNNQYDDIYEQQQNYLSAGKLAAEDIDGWKRERNTCTDVHCIDEVFAKWRAAAKDIEQGQSWKLSPASQQSARVEIMPARSIPAQNTGTREVALDVAPKQAEVGPFAKAEPSSASTSTPDKKPPPSTVNAVLGLAVLGVILFIVVRVLSFIAAFFNRCDKCGRRGAGRLINKEEVGRRRETKLKTVTETHRDRNYRVTGTTQRKVPVSNDVVTYKKTYKCRYCNHIWSKRHEA